MRWVATLLIVISFSGFAQTYKALTYNIRLAIASDGVNAWENRKEALTNQLRFYEPDVFGIQEGRPEQVDFLDKNLEDYSYIGVGRDDGKREGEFSAIYYKQDRLSLIQDSTFWLSETPETPSKSWDAAYPRVCTFGLFEDQKTKQQFWIFNTHFDHVGVVARSNSAKLILETIEKLNTKNLPVIFMGDLNLTPDEEPIQLLLSILKDSRALSVNPPFGPLGTWNSFDFNSNLDRRIDYIMVNDIVKVKKYAVLTDSYNQNYLSDHLPVFVELFF